MCSIQYYAMTAYGEGVVKHHIFLNSSTQSGGQLQANNQSNTSAGMDARGGWDDLKHRKSVAMLDVKLKVYVQH
jgi:hypothetical protein